MVKDIKKIGNCVYFTVTASILQESEIGRIREVARNLDMELSDLKKSSKGTHIVYRNSDEAQAKKFETLLKDFR